MLIENWEEFVEIIKGKDLEELKEKYSQIDECFVESWLEEEDLDLDVFQCSWNALENETQK